MLWSERDEARRNAGALRHSLVERSAA